MTTMSSSDDDMPLASRQPSAGSTAKPEPESEDDIPLNRRRSAQRVVSYNDSDEDDGDHDDDDVPLSGRAANQPSARGKKRVVDGDDDDEYDDAVKGSQSPKKRVKKEPNGKAQEKKQPASKVKKEPTTKAKKEPTAKVKKEPGTTPAKATPTKSNGKASNGKAAIKKENGSTAKSKVKKEESNEEEEDDENNMWWLQDPNDNSVKWNTLEHQGVMFPPAYEPLPKSVRLVYDGKPVDLHPDAEEVAGFFGAMLNAENHVQNPRFQQNFFEDFKQVLKETGGATHNGDQVKIISFEKCDFSKIFDFYDKQREQKKALPAAEKKKLKAEKDAIEEPFKFCLIDGRKEPVGNFRVEPPGLFRGRGDHPKTGKLKRRVQPEQITINIGKEAKSPEPPKGHKWGSVQHDNTVGWLANWKENINGNNKYVLLGNSSSLKGQSDFKKFEKARMLKDYIEGIRKDYRANLDAKEMVTRQMATAIYLIDVLALRAGGEKGEDEADTVGCCSLRYEHITLQKPRTVIFDFLGKDSIRYYQEVQVDQKVFRNLKIFKKEPKKSGDDIFDRLETSTLNQHLSNYMEGLTAKVFRTYNASHTMQQQLDDLHFNESATVNEKVVAFNAANRTVAILCNHQRTVAKGHETQMAKIADKIKELQWQKIRTKKMILQVDSSLKKKEKGYFEDIDDLTKDEIAQIHEQVLEREKARIEKKHPRDLEKVKEENKKIRAENKKLPENEKKELKPEPKLKEMLKKVDELKKMYAKELKSGKPEVTVSSTPDKQVEKYKAQVAKLEERISNTQLQMQDKDENSTVALGTSKMNYIDPRLPAMFSKKHNVPIEKLFTKTLREKFHWAIQTTEADWRF